MADCLACVAGLLILASSVQGEGQTVKITDGVYGFDLGAFPNLPYTAMFVVTGAGVMVIDPFNTASATAMLQEIRKVTSEPIRYVFYSHDHWDHASGGQVFKNEGAEIIAHNDANEWIKSNTGPDQIPADSTWYGSTTAYTLGQFTMELHHFGSSHGNGMTVFVVDSQPRVAYFADIAAVKTVGAFFLPGFDTKGWENTLEKALQLDFEKAVFTHSPPQGGTKQDLANHLGFVRDLRGGVQAELIKGTNPFAIRLELDKYKDWAGYDQQFQLNVQHVIVEALLGPWAAPANKKNSIQPKSNRVSTKTETKSNNFAKWHIKSGF